MIVGHTIRIDVVTHYFVYGSVCARCHRSQMREGFFVLSPVSPPVHFEGSKIATVFFWTGDFVNSTFLSGRFCEQHECTAKHVHSYGARLSEVYIFMYCAQVYTGT